MSKYKAIIFDFNGVLLWDMHWHQQVWHDFSKKLRGTSFTDEEFELMSGRSNQGILEYLLNKKIASEEAIKLSEEKEKIYQNMVLVEKNAGNYSLSTGAEALLDYLVANKIPHTIGTSSCKFNMDFYIEQLNLSKWFDLDNIVSTNDNIRGKPFPDIYLKAAEKLGFKPSECIVVEDAISGIEAAKAAGIGKIIGLAPKEKQAVLQKADGVSEVVANLAEISKQMFYY